MTATLEKKIVAALSDDGMTSTALLALAGEVDAAILEGEAAARLAHEQALDPLQTPDATAARAAAEDASFGCQRLKALLPKVHAKHDEVEAVEYTARWSQDYQSVEAQTAALAQELADFYPPMLAKLTDLLDRIAANDAACSRVAQSAPHGEHRRLVPAEQLARGYWSIGFARLAEKVALPAWEENRSAWPRPSSIAALFAPPPHPLDNWAEHAKARGAAIRTEHARVADFYQRQAAEREERENREAAR